MVWFNVIWFDYDNNCSNYVFCLVICKFNLLFKRLKKNILFYDGIFIDIYNICVFIFCCSFGFILEYKCCFFNSVNVFCLFLL